MLFKQKTFQAEFDNIEPQFTYHIFHTEADNESELKAIDDIDLFLGADYGTSILCKDKEELDKLLNKIDEKLYKTLKLEYDYNGIPILEVNGIFLVSLEIDHFEEEKCESIMNNFIVIGAQCDDVSLIDLFEYRKSVIENKFPDRELKDLETFFQEKLSELEEEYLENNKEDDYYELEVSIDHYLRILEYCGNGSQKEKLDFIVDSLHDSFYELFKIED